MPSFLMNRIRFKTLLDFVRYAEAYPWTKAAERLSLGRADQLRLRGGRKAMLPRKGCERPRDRRRNRAVGGH